MMEFEKIRETLKKIGLGHNESKIYITLLKLGPSMAGKIAKESNIDRSACYDSLKALLKKGLVNYVIEANRKKFSATNPQKLKDYIQEKESLVNEIIPDLSTMFKSKEEKSQVQMFKGMKGIKSVFEDILREAKGGENLVIDSSGSFIERMPYFAPHFIKALKTNKISVRHISLKEKKESLGKNPQTKFRFFTSEIKSSPIATNIYADKIAFILWSDVPEAVIIKNRAAAEAYHAYFEILWNSSKK